MAMIQVAGHVCVDLKPRLSAAGAGAPGELVSVGPMGVTVGGAVGNCGRVLAGMGLEVALSGSIGDDELGLFCRQLLQSLPGSEVDLSVVPGSATSYSVVVEPRGVDRSFWHHTGANDAFTGDCTVTATHLLHYGYPSLTPAMCAGEGRPIRALFERAHSQGVATSLDLAFVASASPVRTLDWGRLLRGIAPACDVICPSWDDLVSCLGLAEDAGDDEIESWASQALGWGAAIVLVTLGPRGSYLRVAAADRLSSLASCGIEPSVWAGHACWTPAPVVDHIVTTNGAGDAFKAAFLAGLVGGGSPRKCLDLAGQVVARHLSGRPLSEGETPERPPHGRRDHPG